jgi:hypothetical protein
MLLRERAERVDGSGRIHFHNSGIIESNPGRQSTAIALTEQGLTLATIPGCAHLHIGARRD